MAGPPDSHCDGRRAHFDQAAQDWVDIENLIAARGDKLDLDWIRPDWQLVLPFADPRMVRLMELVGKS